METIKLKFDHFSAVKSDINEHLPTLRDLAKECEHITDMGVRDVVSTWAFLLGLANNSKKKKVLRSYDIHKSVNIDLALNEAKANNIDMTFTEVDVLKTEIEETDLLFIDTLHTYTQLKNELKLHASKAKKYIVFHDIVTYGRKPEPASWQTPEIMKNYVQNDKGILFAIEEFLKENFEWDIKAVYENNNGLLVLFKNA